MGRVDDAGTAPSGGDAPTLADSGSDASLPRRRAPILGAGEVVGRYIVVSKLGAGGMGVVYAAYDPELDRKVALKLLHSTPGGSASSAGKERSRLVREAQAMAQLNHPNVVTVHDVGEHEGRIFVAMEFVDGATLTDWLAAEKRSLEQVLPIMMAAGQGLVAAHAKGLVHRDFKPDNVMVGADGRARVMDFGLARPVSLAQAVPEASAELSGELSASSGTGRRMLQTPLTQEGSLVGTPAYMSPEQFAGVSTDERTDQFAFCLVLYEALYGQRPFGGKSLGALALAVTSGNVRPEPADVHLPKPLRKAILRGLSSAPEDRWPSMAVLLENLRALTRRGRRIGGLVVGAGLVGALAIGGLVATGMGGDEPCAGGASQLAGVWDDDRRERVHNALMATGVPFAADTWSRVEPMLDAYGEAWVDGYQDACEATRVRQDQSAHMMDLRMRCLDRRRGAFGAMVESLLGANGETVSHAVREATSLPPVSSCADVDYVQAQVPPPDDPAVAERAKEIGLELERAQALARVGKVEEGLQRAKAVHDEAQGLDYAPLAGRTKLGFGMVLVKAGRYDEAVPYLREAYFDGRRLGVDELAALAALQLVENLGSWKAQHDLAYEWSDHARVEVERIGEERLGARLSDSLGLVHTSAGHFEDAITEHSRALEIWERLFGSDSVQAANSHSNLGAALNSLGRPDEAEKHHEQALEITRRVLGPEHPENAITYTNLGNIAWARGEFEKAVELHEKALGLNERAFGDTHPITATTMNNLAGVLFARGEYRRALDLNERALAIKEQRLGPDHPEVGQILDNIGNAQVALGQAEKALAAHERALAVSEKALGPDHRQVLTTVTNVGVDLQAAHRYEEALSYYHRAVAGYEKSLGPDHPYVAIARNNVAEVLLATGELDAALETFTGVATAFEASLGPDHPLLGWPLTGIGNIHLEQGRAAKAIEPLERALTVREQGGVASEELAATRFALARARWATGGDRTAARQLAEQALADYETSQRVDVDATENVRAWLSKHR